MKNQKDKKKNRKESPIPMIILLVTIALGTVGLIYSFISG
jgi:flagellar basal body-associated protein FliL